MKFRLTYEGELRATQRDAERQQINPLAMHKHSIRRSFHHQLKELWRTHNFLSKKMIDVDNPLISRPISDQNAYWGGDKEDALPFAEYVARRNVELGYRWVPLVCEEFSLLCSLRILFLRRDIPGSLLTAGDIDNRIKTIIDALRRPRSPNELVQADQTPCSDENPFFCLLEDDKQVHHLEVETDTLLDPMTDSDTDAAKARLVITVELRPYDVTYFNLSFSG